MHAGNVESEFEAVGSRNRTAFQSEVIREIVRIPVSTTLLVVPLGRTISSHHSSENSTKCAQRSATIRKRYQTAQRVHIIIHLRLAW